MSDAKTASEYLEHANVPSGECTMYWREGFALGHSAGLSEGVELADAIAETYHGSHMKEECAICRALAKFNANRGKGV